MSVPFNSKTGFSVSPARGVVPLKTNKQKFVIPALHIIPVKGSLKKKMAIPVPSSGQDRGKRGTSTGLRGRQLPSEGSMKNLRGIYDESMNSGS